MVIIFAVGIKMRKVARYEIDQKNISEVNLFSASWRIGGMKNPAEAGLS